MKIKRYKWYVGIDPGVNTGFSIWNGVDRRLMLVDSMPIHEAMANVSSMDPEQLSETLFRVEDARQRTWFGKNNEAQLQGAGSIKRDSTIWEDFLKSKGANYEMVKPKHNRTKLKAEPFVQYTGWKEKTNEHGRDSAMLVFGI